MTYSAVPSPCRSEELGIKSRAALLAAYPKQRAQVEAALDPAQLQSCRALMTQPGKGGAAGRTAAAAATAGKGSGGGSGGAGGGSGGTSATGKGGGDGGSGGGGGGGGTYTGIGGCWGLSDQAASVAEEIAMGMAPVGPRRPPDFVRTMPLYPGSEAEQQQQQNQRSTPPTGDARQAAAAATAAAGGAAPRVKLPHAPVAAGDSAPITGLGLRSASVAATVAAMQGHAAELRREVTAAETVIASRRGGEAAVAAALDRGYVAAQRCSIWRGRVQVRSRGSTSGGVPASQ